MKKMTIPYIYALLLIFSGILSAQDMSEDYDKNWPQWRGPLSSGIALTGNPPISWNENLNIKWKSEIPGKGHATPIVWGEQIFLLSAVPTDKEATTEESDDENQNNSWMSPVKTNYIHEFAVISVDKGNGKILWKKVVREELPYSHTHKFGSWASNSPVTDGERIYAYFGSHGLYCLDMDGKILWERDMGRMEKHMSFGEGSSPVLHENKLIILRDHNGQSFLHVLDKETGEVLWEVLRDEQTSWSTPFVTVFEGKTQVITSATGKVRSYNLENGNLIWESSGLTRNVIPTPVMADGIVYFMSGFRGSAMMAVDLSKASGDISDSDAIIWRYDQNTPYTPSSLLLDGKLYFLKSNNGYLTCLDAKNGTEFYSSEKLEGIQNIFTSPVAVENRIYIAGTNGTFYVIKQGAKFEVMSKNILDDEFLASPVIVGSNLILRGAGSLYCISEE